MYINPGMLDEFSMFLSELEQHLSSIAEAIASMRTVVIQNQLKAYCILFKQIFARQPSDQCRTYDLWFSRC